MQANRESTQSLSELGRELGLTFPPSARVLRARRESGIDDAVLAKIEINKNEFQAFFAKTPIDPAAMRPDTGGLSGLGYGLLGSTQGPGPEDRPGEERSRSRAEHRGRREPT
jgi:hypothetical protein